MKRLNVTTFRDDVIESITDLELLGVYSYLASNFFDQGVSCPESDAANIVSEHFDMSLKKAEHLIDCLREEKTDLNFLVFQKKE